MSSAGLTHTQQKNQIIKLVDNKQPEKKKQNTNQSRETKPTHPANRAVIRDENSHARARRFHGILRASARHLAAALRPVALGRDAGEAAQRDEAALSTGGRRMRHGRRGAMQGRYAGNMLPARERGRHQLPRRDELAYDGTWGRCLCRTGR